MPDNNRPIDDEFAFIRNVSGMFTPHRQKTLVHNGDDAAVYLPQENKAQIICVDTMVEEIHFNRQTMSPFHIGYKSLAINLSDIAAMGGEPTYFLVALAIPPGWTEEELKEMYRGMKMLADKWQVDLLGGDTTSAKQDLVLSVTVVGEGSKKVQLLRSNAQAGDIVFVTGPIGDSAAGLDILLASDHVHNVLGVPDVSPWTPLIQAHQLPQPHVQQGLLLSKCATLTEGRVALNDISDGIASEANEIATSSRVDLLLYKEKLPLSSSIMAYAEAQNKDAYDWALFGGEDFVLIGTTTPALFEKIKQQFNAQQLSIFSIGEAQKATGRAGTGQVWLESEGRKLQLQRNGYNHFS